MKFDYQEFIAKKHSKFLTPDEIVDQVILKATGKKPIKRTRLIIGEANEVYDVKTEDDKNVILRISREQSFETEAWAMERSRKQGVPVPKILLIDEIAASTEHLFVCVLSKETGTPLTLDITKNMVDLKSILNEAGHYLSLIHQTTTKGWGHLHKDSQGEFETFREYTKDLIRKEQLFKSIATKNNMNPIVVSSLIRELTGKIQDLKLTSPVLLHGDFSPKHILVKNGKITSILDFGNCRGGFPIHDFAWWKFWWRNPMQIDWLKEGYENKESLGDFDFNLHMIKGFLDLELLYWTNQTKHLGGIETAKNNLVEDLEYLKNYEKS